MITLICEECKKKIHFDYDRCEECASKNLLKVYKGKYYFQGQVFSKNKWYRKMGNYLYFEKDRVSLRRFPDEIRIKYIKTFVLKNIKKSTFLMLILPCILFFVLSLTLLWGVHIIEINAKFLNYNQIVFVRFLGALFFVFGSSLLVKLIIFQDKVIMLGTDKRIRMKHINKNQYIGVIDVFKKE